METRFMVSPELSIVLPCYNEARGIETILNRFAAVAGEARFELILVDNGSTDSTADVLRRLLPSYPFARSVKVEANQGYGHGILAGLQAATAEVLAWSHADLQTDPADVVKGFKLLQQSKSPSTSIVKGCRRGRSWSERAVSFGMQTLATVLFRTRLHDINAQPKVFHRRLLSNIVEPPNDFNWDVYVLFMAKRSGWRIESFPVDFPPRKFGQSHWAAHWRSRLRTMFRSACYMWRLGVAGGR